MALSFFHSKGIYTTGNLFNSESLLTKSRSNDIIIVSIDTMESDVENKGRIESLEEVTAYLERLYDALENDAVINVQTERQVDRQRDERYTNKFTLADLFPDEAPSAALRRELKKLTVGNYIRTVKDTRFPNRSEMREFGMVYNEKDEVYIKIRLELVGKRSTVVRSFN